MSLEPSVQVALIGIVTTAMATGGVVIVALINRKSPSPQIGEANEILRQRIELRDEQIEDLHERLREKDDLISRLMLALEKKEDGVSGTETPEQKP